MFRAKRKLVVLAAAVALLSSVLLGSVGDALAAGGGGVSAYGITWCRTCN